MKYVPQLDMEDTSKVVLNKKAYTPRAGKQKIRSPLFSDFGRDAIKITIGNRPSPPQPRFSTPGPSEYGRPELPNRRIPISFPRSPRANERPPLTSNIDFIGPQSHLDTRSIILPRTPRAFYEYKSDTPGPGVYDIPDTLSKKSFQIRNIVKSERTNDTPGPGSYEPCYSQIDIGKTIMIGTGVKDRTKWLVLENNPGAGTYDPRTTLCYPRDTFKTIGRKSRPKRSHKYNPPPGPFRPFAVGGFIINLKNGMTPYSMRHFLLDFPEIKEFLDEIQCLILRDKPDNALEYLRNYFSSFYDSEQK